MNKLSSVEFFLKLLEKNLLIDKSRKMLIESAVICFFKSDKSIEKLARIAFFNNSFTLI